MIHLWAYRIKKTFNHFNILKHAYALILSLLLVVGVNSVYAANESDNLPQGLQKKDAVILIQSARSAKIEQDKTQNGIYTITLKNVIPDVSFVGDRPNRAIGKISLERYLKLWQAEGKNSFRNSPPNAIIHGMSGPEKTPLYFALEISEPKYNADTKTLEYKAKALSGENSNIPASAVFDHITVIIDDVCIGCWD